MVINYVDQVGIRDDSLKGNGVTSGGVWSAVEVAKEDIRSCVMS